VSAERDSVEGRFGVGVLGDVGGLGLGVAGVGEGFELTGCCCLGGRTSDGLGVVEQVYGVGVFLSLVCGG